jgi:uncharacterized repeat protein (TIGR01451 family)
VDNTANINILEKGKEDLTTKIRIIASILLLTLCVSSMVGFATAKSLYGIASINQSPSPVQAYDIQAGGTLVYQATYGVPYYAGGAVGLGIDSSAAVLFVTYEVSNVIQLLNAVTMTSLGTTTAPGASNLAGIVVDQGKNKVYTVDRNTNHLYVYNWNPTTKILSLDLTAGGGDGIVDLTGVTDSYGLALDETNDLLYVGNNVASGNVKVFSTATWASTASYTMNQTVMGLALDTINGILYTGNAYPGYGSTGLLCKYNINTATQTTLNIRSLTGATSDDNVVGLAVDQDTGILYISTGNQGTGGSDRLLAIGSTLNVLYATGDIGDPTGIAIPTIGISYNPLSLSKTDNPDPVAAGAQLTYTISFGNALNNFPVNNVQIVDTLSDETNFVSASDGGTYDSNTRKVTWNIGTLAAGALTRSLTLTVTVHSDADDQEQLDNTVTIDSDQTPPTTQHAFTTVAGTPPQNQVPEVPLGTIIAAASMIAALGTFLILPRFRSKPISNSF